MLPVTIRSTMMEVDYTFVKYLLGLTAKVVHVEDHTIEHCPTVGFVGIHRMSIWYEFRVLPPVVNHRHPQLLPGGSLHAITQLALAPQLLPDPLPRL